MLETDPKVFRTRRKKTDYINNQDLFEALIKYQDHVAEELAKGNEQPQITEYIGKAIWMICNRLVYMPNFINYTWRDEMVEDAIIACISAVLKFKREKTNNPFGYFTKIAYHACVMRIKEEKKNNYLKHKNLQNEHIFGLDNEFASIDFNLESHNAVIDDYERKK